MSGTTATDFFIQGDYMLKKLFCVLIFFILPVASLGETVQLDEYFSKRELSGKWEAESAVQLSLTDSVEITEAGVYILSGTIADGTVTIRVGKDDKVQLVLDNVYISSSSSAAILVENADKVFITLPEGTENNPDQYWV